MRCRIKCRPDPARGFRSSYAGYLLTEALVYISVVMVVVGVGYVAMYRSINNSLALRRSTDDIGKALSAGELWRADVRHAVRLRIENPGEEQIVWMEGAERTNAWRHSGMSVMRKAGDGPWVTVLVNVREFSMKPNPRGKLEPWRLELELMTRSKSARIRPLFTFTSVPNGSSLK